ncbi:multicopper oxidase family protein [Terrabacter terrigena]|uniref:Multicopper oxidase family protein n=1 Tax=Terrabacter terrigena TaxID=574718 RepID=A0ABW3MQV5_9MICO
MSLSRRDLMKLGVVGGAALALPLERTVSARSSSQGRLASSRLPRPFTLPFRTPPVLRPHRTDATTDFYKVYMKPLQAEVVPGLQTPLWGYNGLVPGPTVKVAQGRQTVMRQVNNLPRKHPLLNYTPWTSVHLHGSPSLPQYDGYASDITNPGQYKDYVYPNTQTGRTLWYHDHGLHHTAENVLMGLAAQYQLVDPLERSLPIPKGEFDVPLLVSDAMFASNGSLYFDNHSESGMYGDVVLVNGVPWPVMQVKRRKYRFRILNASISRSYQWSLDSGDPMTVIATDAGLMPRPQKVQRFRHGAAERYEVVIDFSKMPVGRRVVLRNTSPKNNIDYENTNKVMAFDVVADPFDTSYNSVPDLLNPTNPAMLLTAKDAVRTRQLNLVREHGMWTINGHTWDDVVKSKFDLVEANPREGDVEIWEIRNSSGGWFHPVHIHLIDFRILDRNGKPPMPHELGPKDVVYVGENETVRVVARFEGRGKYMIHCHNLVHEDHDMMSQFEVLADHDVSDPLSDPCKGLPETSDL